MALYWLENNKMSRLSNKHLSTVTIYHYNGIALLLFQMKITIANILIFVLQMFLVDIAFAN